MNSKRRKVRCDRQFRFLIHEKLITCSKVSIVSLRSSHGDVDTREQCQTKRRRKKKRKKIRYFWLIWNQLKSFYFVLFTFQLILLRWHKVDLVIILFVCNWRVNKILNLLKFTFLTSFLVRFNFNEWQIYTTNLIQLKGSSINDVKKRISLFFYPLLPISYLYHTPTWSRILLFDIVTSFMNNQFKEWVQFCQPCLKHMKIRLLKLEG